MRELDFFPFFYKEESSSTISHSALIVVSIFTKICIYSLIDEEKKAPLISAFDKHFCMWYKSFETNSIISETAGKRLGVISAGAGHTL
ncbi:unnamed protein product [Blepharisma stoltei]|uniref:Uncharacterized protein n=1 Tax=Blepharisma stoltei TaxID=1481888 RepID=A0AAU9IW81_9CILI|nr:unnamed protein product [Blepharisma stoltei]